jgi:hypothetical protein
MATFGDLKDEIASELGRDDLDTQIGYACLDALRSLETYKAPFNSDVDTSLSTTDGSNVMALPSNAFAVKTITLDVGSYQQPLVSISYEDIVRGNTDSSFTAQPCAYTVFDGQIYFDVAADAVYSAVVSFWKKFTLPTSATDDSATHAWITNAYTLVKHKTKAQLYAATLFDIQTAEVFEGMADKELRRIQSQLAMQSDSNPLSLRP